MKILILCVILLSALIVLLLIKLQVQKNQVRAFTKQINEIREQGHSKLINVDTFNPDYVKLANELNSYVQMEQELLDKATEDRQSVKMMVAGISHDFRTPLTATAGYMQMVRQSQDISKKDAEYLDIAISKTNYLRNLSDEFFTLSLIENGRREEDVKLLSIKSILENVTIAQYDWIKEREIEFNPQITDDPCNIKAVEVDMLRLFENLYSNAKKYAYREIKVSLAKEEDGIHFSICNDIESISELTDGITSENVDEVFRPFHRASSSGMPGNGLGLYISKLIVDSYEGTITARMSEEGMFEISIVL